MDSAVRVAPKRRELSLIQGMPSLTRREIEIVQLLRRGYSNKEIAKELGISVTTVKWNITNILGKFGVETSKQLIALLATSDTDSVQPHKS